MKKLKLQSFKALLPFFLMFWGLTLFLFICIVIPTLKTFSDAPISFEEINFTEDVDGLYVTGPLYGIYGSYCELIDRYGDVTGREYIIQVSDEYFMALYATREADIRVADKLMDATYAYYEGTDDGSLLLDSQYTVTGVIEDIRAASIGYYNDYLSDLDTETRARYLPYYIRVTNTESENRMLNLVYWICFILDVPLLVLLLVGFFQRPIRKYIKSSSNPTLTREKVDEFINSTPEVDGLRYNRDFICGVCDGFTVLIDTAKVSRIYPQTENVTIKFLQIKAHTIVLGMKDGTKKSLNIKNHAVTSRHINNIHQLCPWITIGMFPRKVF